MSRRKRKKVVVGRINGPWGVHGHVKVTPLTSNPERFVPGATLLLDGIPRKVLDVQSPRGYPCVQFRGYHDRSAAESLTGTLIEIPESDLPELPYGEYYVHDLVGLEVGDSAGTIGRLKEVLRTGANDVYVVTRSGAKDLLLPAIADVILDVDLEAGRMTVEVLPGLDGETPSPVGRGWRGRPRIAAVRAGFLYLRSRSGDVAQLGERRVRNAEAGGSSPPISTTRLPSVRPSIVRSGTEALETLSWWSSFR